MISTVSQLVSDYITMLNIWHSKIIWIQLWPLAGDYWCLTCTVVHLKIYNIGKCLYSLCRFCNFWQLQPSIYMSSSRKFHIILCCVHSNNHRQWWIIFLQFILIKHFLYVTGGYKSLLTILASCFCLKSGLIPLCDVPMGNRNCLKVAFTLPFVGVYGSVQLCGFLNI